MTYKDRCTKYENTTCKSYKNGTCKSYKDGTCKTYVNDTCKTWKNTSCKTYKNTDCRQWQNTTCKSYKNESTDKCAILYQHSYYNGVQWKFCPGKPLPTGWGNQASSLKVPSGGKLKVCENSNGGGQCWTYTSNNSWIGNARNDKISYVSFEVDGFSLTSDNKGGFCESWRNTSCKTL